MASPARLADPGFPGSEKRREGSSDAILGMQNVETDLGILNQSVVSYHCTTVCLKLVSLVIYRRVKKPPELEAVGPYLEQSWLL
jgi:hypothetical protein